jgi:hypothetical protein
VQNACTFLGISKGVDNPQQNCSEDEGSRIAVNVAKLPGLLSKPQCSAWKVIDHAFGEMFSGVAI